MHGANMNIYIYIYIYISPALAFCRQSVFMVFIHLVHETAFISLGNITLWSYLCYEGICVVWNVGNGIVLFIVYINLRLERSQLGNLSVA